MKFDLAVLCVTFGPIVVQAVAVTTPLAQLKCTPGFYLCARNDAWCNGKESVVRILTHLSAVNHTRLRHGPATIGPLQVAQLTTC